MNVNGSSCLLAAMQNHGCHNLEFRSSATLYGYPKAGPIPETAPIEPINPYGHTKAAVEQMLSGLYVSTQDSWRIACLRYFKPVSAHPSGRIGENPLGIPNNLFPFLSQVADGRRDQLQVFGGGWPTPDGTGVRDTIQVMDLAQGRAALDCMLAEAPQLLTLNLGAARDSPSWRWCRRWKPPAAVPSSTRFPTVGMAMLPSASPIPLRLLSAWAGAPKALSKIYRDGWAWQQQNPGGYA